MAQMLTCFSLLRFYKVGVGNRGGGEGLSVAKIVNTDNPHPQGTVCRSVSGPLLQPNNKSQEDGGTDHNCSLFATISRCSDRYHKWCRVYRGAAESLGVSRAFRRREKQNSRVFPSTSVSGGSVSVTSAAYPALNLKPDGFSKRKDIVP